MGATHGLGAAFEPLMRGQQARRHQKHELYLVQSQARGKWWNFLNKRYVERQNEDLCDLELASALTELPPEVWSEVRGHCIWGRDSFYRSSASVSTT